MKKWNEKTNPKKNEITLEELEIIYMKDRVNWIDHYINECNKDIQACKNELYRLTEEKNIINEKLNNHLHQRTILSMVKKTS